MTCSFTGHRPSKLMAANMSYFDSIALLKRLLKKEITEKINSGVDTFMSGMALGVDQLAAETVLELKKEYPQIKLVAVIPCVDQDQYWKEKDKQHYQKLVAACDEKKVLQEKYTSACMHVRNRYLVDHADCMIAVWNGSPGGTSNTVALAKKKGIPLTIINPSTMTCERLITSL